MSFNKNLPAHYEELQTKLAGLYSKRNEMYHECDCDYCTVSGDLSDEYTVEELEAVEKDIADTKQAIKTLKEYAEFNKLPLEKPKELGVVR